MESWLLSWTCSKSDKERATAAFCTSVFPIGLIMTIDWTYIGFLDSFFYMDQEIRLQEQDREPSDNECECPEPCNCDHENE